MRDRTGTIFFAIISFALTLVIVGLVMRGQVPPQTPTPTSEPIPPSATNTLIPPSATNTLIPPTATSTPSATNTPIPPSATSTPIPPSATNTPTPMNTATNTPIPPSATSTPPIPEILTVDFLNDFLREMEIVGYGQPADQSVRDKFEALFLSLRLFNCSDSSGNDNIEYCGPRTLSPSTGYLVWTDNVQQRLGHLPSEIEVQKVVYFSDGTAVFLILNNGNSDVVINPISDFSSVRIRK